jgi:hypothetical protein
MAEQIINLKHTAAGQMAGYLYQIDRALVLLCLCKSKESVSIELVDDVATIDEKGNIIYREQDKSSILENGHPFRDRSKDLWNTLMIWITEIKCKSIDISKTKFICATNKKLSDTSLIKRISQAETLSEIEAVITLLESVGKTSNAVLRETVTKVLAEKKILKKLIPQITLLDSDSFEKRNEEIANELHLKDEIKDGVIELLRGWLQNSILKQLDAGKAPVIKKTDFIDRLDKAKRESAIFIPYYFKNLKDSDTDDYINYLKLKNQDLLYFSDEENTSISEIANVLKSNSTSMLLGDAATGKTITVFCIAEKLKKYGYDIFYLKLSGSTNPTPLEIIKEAELNLSKRYVFILDDVHQILKQYRTFIHILKRITSHASYY